MSEDPRISEIRAVLDAGCDDFDGCWDCVARHQRIRAILDRPAPTAEQRPVDWPAVAEAFADEIAELNPPAPRVFFPGDTVPAGVVVIIPHVNDGYSCYFGPLNIGPTDGYAIELPIPTAAERQAAVDRARAERPEVQP